MHNLSSSARLLFAMALLAFATTATASSPKDPAPEVPALPPAVTLGAPYQVVDAPVKAYVSVDGAAIAVKVDGERYTIQRFPNDAVTEGSVHTYEDLPRDAIFEAVQKFDGKVLVFFSVWDGAGEHEQLFFREVDAATGTFVGPGGLRWFHHPRPDLEHGTIYLGEGPRALATALH